MSWCLIKGFSIVLQFFFQKQKNKSVISKHVDLSCLTVKPSDQTNCSRGLALPQKAVHLSYIQGVVGSIPHIFYVSRLEKYKYRLLIRDICEFTARSWFASQMFFFFLNGSLFWSLVLLNVTVWFLTFSLNTWGKGLQRLKIIRSM